MKEKNIDIYVENGVLHIKAEREFTERHKLIHRERYTESFSRSFVLPEDAEAEGIKASYEKGILTVAVPRKEKAQRRIEIKVSNAG